MTNGTTRWFAAALVANGVIGNKSNMRRKENE